jgi:ribosomal protein L21E
MRYSSVSTLFVLPAICLLAVLPGCKQPSYTPKSLYETQPNKSFTAHKNGIHLSVKQATKKEADHFFDGRGGRLLRKRKAIHLIYIQVENKSTGEVILHPAHISLKILNPGVVASRLYSHTARRIVTPLVLGTLGVTVAFLGAAYLTILGAIGAMPAAIKAGYASLGIAGFIALGSPTLSYYQGTTARSTNQLIDKDLLDKTLTAPLTIKPGTIAQKLIFVSYKSYQPIFELDLLEVESGKTLSFTIDLKKEMIV